MANKSYDLVVIGAGPGGEVGAIKAAQLGLKVALIEKRKHLGGTCLNVGCIPTKALLQSAKTWDKLQHAEKEGFSVGKVAYDWNKILGKKDKIVNQMRKGLQFLMKKNKVDVYQGVGSITGRNSVQVTDENGKKEALDTKFILLATGSKVKELPFAQSNGKNIMSSDHVLSIESVPKTLAIVGGGVVGMEFASLFGRMGSKVTVIEFLPNILPSEDEETVKEATKWYKKQNISIETSTKLTGVSDNNDHCVVSVEGKEDRKFDKVLMSVGRVPVTDGLGLEKIGIRTEKGGFLKVNEKYQTAVPNIYAIGDIIPTAALAHTASAEAGKAVAWMANQNPRPINYDANPGAIYSWPEVASIGITEQKAKAESIAYKTAKFPFSALAKANIEGATMGFIKIIFEPKYKEILGVHICGATATELIAEFALGKVLETTVDEIAETVHPHPTISETVMEAAHAALGEAIHM